MKPEDATLVKALRERITEIKAEIDKLHNRRRVLSAKVAILQRAIDSEKKSIGQ